jgi:hypothetical protein
VLFIAAALAVPASARWMAQRLAWTLPARLWRLPPYVIGGLASFWVLERVTAF